jgi:type IV secretion system protein TrbB
MQTTADVRLRTLLWIAMRNSPNAIMVSEVRDGSALDLLKAWNTGTPGGLATIHANSPLAALLRLVDLACEAIAIPPYGLVGEAIDVVVQIEHAPNITSGRLVTDIIEVHGFDRSKNEFITRTIGDADE